jgi:hypothetical protein
VRVRVLVSIASADWAYHPGQVVDLPEPMARTWISSGLASPLPEPEAAVVEAPEQAVQPRPRARKGGR